MGITTESEADNGSSIGGNEEQSYGIGVRLSIPESATVFPRLVEVWRRRIIKRPSPRRRNIQKVCEDGSKHEGRKDRKERQESDGRMSEVLGRK